MIQHHGKLLDHGWDENLFAEVAEFLGINLNLTPPTLRVRASRRHAAVELYQFAQAAPNLRLPDASSTI